MKKTNKLFFVDAIAGEKNGRKYSLVSLSDGLRTATTNNPNSIDTSHLTEGDEVKATFDVAINFRNEFQTTLVALDKA